MASMAGEQPTMAVARAEDADEILALQKLCYRSEAEIYGRFDIEPLTQTLEQARADMAAHLVLKLVQAGQIIGSVRGREEGDSCLIGKLIVHPERQNRGYGRRLLAELEARFPGCRRFELFTGHRSEKNLALYIRAGYRAFKAVPVGPGLELVYLEKLAR